MHVFAAILVTISLGLFAWAMFEAHRVTRERRQ